MPNPVTTTRLMRKFSCPLNLRRLRAGAQAPGRSRLHVAGPARPGKRRRRMAPGFRRGLASDRDGNAPRSEEGLARPPVDGDRHTVENATSDSRPIGFPIGLRSALDQRLIGVLQLLAFFSRNLTASPTVRIVSAASSGISQPNSSSN